MTDYRKIVNANENSALRDFYREADLNGMPFSVYFKYILLSRWLIHKHVVDEWKNFLNHPLYIMKESEICLAFQYRSIRPKQLTVEFIAMDLKISPLLLHNDEEFQKMYEELPEST